MTRIPQCQEPLCTSSLPPTDRPVASNKRKANPAELLTTDAWDVVVSHLPARSQAVFATSHPVWRDLCAQPKWAMHRARLHYELERCEMPSEIVPVLERHRHVLPYLDTLVLQPALQNRLLARTSAGKIPEDTFESFPEPSELYPALDWLAHASTRPFKILIFCQVQYASFLLTNGIDKRHPLLMDQAFIHYDRVDTPARFIAAMQEKKSQTRVIWSGFIDERIDRAFEHPNFWETYVACYPSVGHLSLTQDVFDTALPRLDALCNLQHLQFLHVPHLLPEKGFPPGLKHRIHTGELKLYEWKEKSPTWQAESFFPAQ